MRATQAVLASIFTLLTGPGQAQEVIEISDRGGLHAAYVVPVPEAGRVDVQLIVMSGTHDDPDPSGTAHLTEHLAAISADATILNTPRARDINASVSPVSTVFTNSGMPSDIDTLMQLSRAVLDRPVLPDGYAETEIDILTRETMMRERQSPFRWVRRMALQSLYETPRGRANSVIADLPNLSLDKAYAFHAAHYVPANTVLIISGEITPKAAADQVARVFGDTVVSTRPDEPWLAHKPDPQRRAVERVTSDRLSRDMVMLAKFVDFKDHPTSIDMQDMFFISTSILNDRLSKRLYQEEPRILNLNIDWHFAPNADLEMLIVFDLMPGFSVDEAHQVLNEALDTLLDDPILARDIQLARESEIVSAHDQARVPSQFLWFLKNVAADGFPPITPTTFARTLRDTTDEDVIYFIESAMAPSATAVVLAEAEG